MAGKEYQLDSASGALYNGARDTDGGIWIRVRDDRDHGILAAAVAKQMKNKDAATGTLSALDPSAPHLIDYIGDALQRVLDSINGARPASAQLAGTPIGDAMGDPAETGGKKRGRKRAKAGEQTDTTAGQGEPEIEWASDVPSPRPRAGEAFWPPLEFATAIPLVIGKVIGYDAENGQFIVDTPDGVRASIVYNEAWQDFVGAGAPPHSPDATDADTARAALAQLVDALDKAAPATLEDSQFESVAAVAAILLGKVADANDRPTLALSVPEMIDQFRSEEGNAASLAEGIRQNVVALTSLDSESSATGPADVDEATQRETDAADMGAAVDAVAAVAKSVKRSKKAAAKKAAGKGGKKRPR